MSTFYTFYTLFGMQEQYKIGKQLWSYLAKLNSHIYDPTTLVHFKETLGPKKTLRKMFIVIIRNN